MTRPDVETLRDLGLICTAIKRDGQPCCYKKIRGYEVCGRHGAPQPPTRQSPPPTTCECPVCYEVKSAKMLKCKHSLCKDCHKQWFAKNRTCPLCREVVIPVTENDILRHRVYTRIYDAVLDINDMQEHYTQVNDGFVSEFLTLVEDLRDLRTVRRRLFD